MDVGSNLAIGISLILRDRFTGRAQGALGTLRGFRRESENLSRQNAKAMRDSAATGAAIGAIALRTAYRWTKVGADFGYTMNYISTIAKEKGGVTLDRLSEKALQLGENTMFTSRQIASGMRFMAMAGQDTEAVYKNITAATALAAATMSRLEGRGGAADILTNIMRGFDVEATSRNSMRVADILSKATTSANTDLWNLHEAMKYSMSTARDLGITIEETAAMAMMAGDAGIQGSMAGTATENMLRYITRAADETRTGRQGKALKTLGLTPADLQTAQGGLLPVSQLLSTIAKSIDQLGDVKRQNILTDLFGVRGKRQGSLLLRNLQRMDQYVDVLNKGSKGTAMDILNKQMKETKGLMLQLASTAETFMIKYTVALKPVLEPLLKALISGLKLINSLISTPVGKFLAIVATGFVAVKTATLGYRAIVLSLRLAHGTLGSSFAGTSTKVVGGYNAMTAAANRYGAASARASMAGSAFRPGQVYRNQRGTWTQVMPTGGHRFLKSGSGAARMARAGKFLGRASVPAMLGGLALSSLGEMDRDDKGNYGTLGKTASIAGDTLGWAGTGAMIGSVVPGIGTVAGAIVGGVGGLLWGLYDKMDQAEKEVDKAKDGGDKPFNERMWRNKVNKLRQMGIGDIIHGQGYTPNSMWATDRMGANDWLHRPGIFNADRDPNRIIINIDGKEVMDKTINDKMYEEFINIGGF